MHFWRMQLRFVVVLLLVVLALGTGLAPASASPEGGGTADWRLVSSGRHHTCGIRTSGRLYCWGDDSLGQLGDGPGASSTPQPVEVSGDHTDWKTVSAGGNHTCARRSSGRLYCWGYDSHGQLGDGGVNVGQFVPTEVSGGVTTWTSVSAGESHTCARRSNGRLFCWGNDGNGQVGNGGLATEEHVPVQVAGNRTDWASVSAGDFHTCARRTTGRLFCWGSDDPQGQLGNDANFVNQFTPVQVAGARTDWASVSAGGSHTCARRTSGRLFCWGGDGFGEVGNGAAASTPRPTPVQVAGNRTDWGAVSSGENHTCARRTTGRLFCWGRDAFGALGDNLTIADQSSPVQVAGLRTDWATVEAGSNHTCARRTDRRLFCWGNDNDGQVGDGVPFSNTPTPVQVS